MELLHHNISTYGGAVDDLIWLITYFVVFWFAVSFLALVAFSLMSRRKDGVKSTYVKGEGWNQTKWVMIPVILVTLCDGIIDVQTSSVWAAVKGPVQDVKDLKGEDVVEVGILAKQFGFDFSYDAGPDGKFFTEDDGVYEASKLHVPAGKKIVFHLTAQDVLHSLWMKNVRLKQDALPGRFIIGWFEIDPKQMETWNGENIPKDGTFPERKALGADWASAPEAQRSFEIACAEICGHSHGRMRATLVVESEENFKKWIEHEKEEAGEE